MHRWQPAIYEHKASLIGKTPSVVSRSAEDLALACMKEVELYKTEIVVVGIDVYNIELEALGAELQETREDQCPDLTEAIDDLQELPESLPTCHIPEAGRFKTILNAAQLLKNQLDPSVRIVIPVSGPMTLASKWVGMEDLIIDMFSKGEQSDRLLSYFENIAIHWTQCILDHGFEAMVFDSMAAPPMMSPSLYKEHILPRHTRIFDVMIKNGQSIRELVIGGDTTAIVSDEAKTGANVLLCDYACDAQTFSKALPKSYDGTIRRNINPKLLLNKSISREALRNSFKKDLALFNKAIAGTGILAYDFNPQTLLEFISDF